MQGHRWQTKFTTGGSPTVTNRLHALPSPTFARLGRGKRDELLQRLEFSETVFILLHDNVRAITRENFLRGESWPKSIAWYNRNAQFSALRKSLPKKV